VSPRFTEKQGQYLAFIYTYVLLNRQPPAEADFQRFFRVTPPSVVTVRRTILPLGSELGDRACPGWRTAVSGPNSKRAAC
jgi:hypothetical protein